MVKALLSEYGLPWIIYRVGYAAKLRLLRVLPPTEHLFEHYVSIKRIDIFSIDIESISRCLNSLSILDKQTLILEANNATQGIIKGFSSIDLNYGYPINWHLNPLTDVEERSDNKWYRIPDFDKHRGDIKVIWEASRFSHFITFARAYLLTKDCAYYESFSLQLSDWLLKNPYSYGANFKCGQECALRIINTLIAYSVFYQAGLTSIQDTVNTTELVQRCYKKILSNFYYARRCIKNNHTLSELVGLIIGAWCSENYRRLKNAYKLLDSEIQNQFSQDGGYKQFSFNYQRFALQLMEFVQKLSPITGISLSEASRKRLLASAHLLLQCMNEDGDVPNYGSNDGALIFPVTSSKYRDYRPVINTTIAQNTRTFIFPMGKYYEEYYWFGLNAEGIKEVPKKSSCFPSAGIFTLSNSSLSVMICANDYTSRPGHMDQLHVDVWFQGRNIFCDSGTYSYASELGKDLSRTGSHNTVRLADTEQMNLYSNFLVVNWTSRDSYFHDETSFQATVSSKNGYKHSREVILERLKIMITDTVKGSANYAILFHTPYAVLNNSGIIVISDNNIELCRIITECEVSLSVSYRSLYYLQKERITCIELHSEVEKSRTEILFKE